MGLGPVQRRGGPADPDDVHAAAAHGVSGGGGALPFLDVIQPMFGRHDVSGVTAHQDDAARAGAQRMGAAAFATGDHVAFAGTPDLFTAAHEAAHVVQQRGGVSLLGGFDGGRADPYEQHADAVAERVVRGESAEALLDQHAGAGGGGRAVQRYGNEVEPAAGTLDAIHAGAHGVDGKLAALEHSADPALWYGADAKVDEEAEITASATYLAKRKRDWGAELAARGGGAGPTEQTFEKFQRGMNEMTPSENPHAPPWFMNPAWGYNVDGGREDVLQRVADDRDHPDAGDPQQLLGQTYQRDTMFISDSPDMQGAHLAAFDAGITAATAATWAGDVLLVRVAGEEVRMRVTGAVGPDPTVTITGTVLASPHRPPGFAVGAVRHLRKTAGAALEVLDGGGAVSQTIPAGNWNGRLQSWAYYNAWTIANDNLGAHVAGALGNRARNRHDVPTALDNNTFDTVAQRHADPSERSTRRTLGPQRSRLNFHEVGMDISVAPYRRLGGDAIFNEAAHPAAGAYQNQLQPRGAVDTDNPDWYYDQANAMPDRFVGGRSNSTLRYMAAATMLFHRGTLTLAECEDIVAFVIADMVVSGEHSMPECMTSVVMAAAGAEPWNAAGVNLVAPTETLAAWLRLVDDGTKHQMLADAQAHLRVLLADPGHDRKLLKMFAIIDKQLYNHLHGG